MYFNLIYHYLILKIEKYSFPENKLAMAFPIFKNMKKFPFATSPPPSQKGYKRELAVILRYFA